MPAVLIYATKKSLRALDSSTSWTQKGMGRGRGDVQGISTASAARAETLSDALGKRLMYMDSEKFDRILFSLAWRKTSI